MQGLGYVCNYVAMLNYLLIQHFRDPRNIHGNHEIFKPQIAIRSCS